MVVFEVERYRYDHWEKGVKSMALFKDKFAAQEKQKELDDFENQNILSTVRYRVVERDVL